MPGMIVRETHWDAATPWRGLTANRGEALRTDRPRGLCTIGTPPSHSCKPFAGSRGSLTLLKFPNEADHLAQRFDLLLPEYLEIICIQIRDCGSHVFNRCLEFYGVRGLARGFP